MLSSMLYLILDATSVAFRGEATARKIAMIVKSKGAGKRICNFAAIHKVRFGNITNQIQPTFIQHAATVSNVYFAATALHHALLHSSRNDYDDQRRTLDWS